MGRILPHTYGSYYGTEYMLNVRGILVNTHVTPTLVGIPLVAQALQGVPELCLMSPYFLHCSITRGANILEPPD